jgi:hypothetical protein
MIGWAWCGFHKKRDETLYSGLVFFHLVGSAGHVVHFGGSGPRIIDAVLFMLSWARYGFDQKRVGTHYSELVCFVSGGICGSRSAFRCVRGVKRQPTIFHARVGPVRFL